MHFRSTQALLTKAFRNMYSPVATTCKIAGEQQPLYSYASKWYLKISARRGAWPCRYRAAKGAGEAEAGGSEAHECCYGSRPGPPHRLHAVAPWPEAMAGTDAVGCQGVLPGHRVQVRCVSVHSVRRPVHVIIYIAVSVPRDNGK